MDDDLKALGKTLWGVAGVGQSVIIGLLILFDGWMALVSLWPDISDPSVSLNIQLLRVRAWIGHAGEFVVVLVLAAIVGEFWLGLIRFLSRVFAVLLNRRCSADRIGKGVFTEQAIAGFIAHLDEVDENDDLEAPQIVEFRRLAIISVIERCHSGGVLRNEAGATWDRLRGGAELRIGLIPWGPLSFFAIEGSLAGPPSWISLFLTLAALVLTVALAISAFHRWRASNSYLLLEIAKGHDDWGRYARIAAGV